MSNSQDNNKLKAKVESEEKRVFGQPFFEPPIYMLISSCRRYSLYIPLALMIILAILTLPAAGADGFANSEGGHPFWFLPPALGSVFALLFAICSCLSLSRTTRSTLTRWTVIHWVSCVIVVLFFASSFTIPRIIASRFLLGLTSLCYIVFCIVFSSLHDVKSPMEPGIELI